MTPFERELFSVYGLTLEDLHKAADDKFILGSQWTTEECSKLKARQKEIIMARQMTKEERIYAFMNENVAAHKSAMECSYGYCQALVEGLMAVEAKTDNLMTKEEAINTYMKATSLNRAETIQRLSGIEALGLIKFKESEPSLVEKALCSIMIETEVRQGPDYGKLYAAYPTQYGAGCLMDGLRNKGYQITKT